MASAGLNCHESQSQSINGVTLFTRAGKPKARYSRSEMLQILGATEEDLQSFLEIFAPRQPYYAVTKAGSSDPRDWTTPKGRQPHQMRRLRDEEVLRHLVGNLLPERSPRWVAPRAWEATLWVGIDVDFRSDREDFLWRCRKVHRTLKVLGVPRESRLVSRTPSGGRHYRFFLTHAVRTADIPSLLALVGLHHISGQFEIFPSQQRGMRLPFGHLPGHAHQPQRWVTFVRDWKAGRVRRVNWLRCLRRAERFAQRKVEEPRRFEETSNINGSKIYPADRAPRRALSLGIPRRSQSMSRTTGSKDGSETRYQELLYQPWANPSAAQELWNLGIRLPGTRVEATKRLAWHLVHIRRLPLPQAESELSCWVYETGAKYSKDVRGDIAAGTRQVERQTRDIVRWCARQSLERKGCRRQLFSVTEVHAIVTTVRRQTSVNRTDQVEFGLRLLEFAKSHGVQKPGGWEVQISVRGVIRTWPKCSGMRYKPFMDRAIESGLLRRTREKLQSRDGTGRPRTYLIQVPIGELDSTAMAFAEAASYAQASLQCEPKPLNAVGCESNASDTYQNVPPSSPRTAGKIHEAVALESAESISRDDEFSVGTVTENTPRQGISATTNILMGQPNVCSNSSASSGLGHVRYRQPAGRISKTQEREYPPSPGTYLAKGQAERPAIGPSLSGIPDQGIGKLSAPPPRPVLRLTPQQRLFRKGISPLRLKARSTAEVSFQQHERARLNLIKTSLGKYLTTSPSTPVCSERLPSAPIALLFPPPAACPPTVPIRSASTERNEFNVKVISGQKWIPVLPKSQREPDRVENLT